MGRDDKSIISVLGDNGEEGLPLGRIADEVGLSRGDCVRRLYALKDRDLVEIRGLGLFALTEKAEKRSKEMTRGFKASLRRKGIKGDFAKILMSLYKKEIPLGLHYINLMKKDCNVDWGKVDWEIGNSSNEAKTCKLEGLDFLGTTRIWVHKNATIVITYTGRDVNGKKVFLTEEFYGEWKEHVEGALKEINPRLSLRHFQFTQMEMNADKGFNSLQEINKFPENVRIKVPQLEKVFEIYKYEDEDGVMMGRIGVRVDDAGSGVSSLNPEDPFESNQMLDFLLGEIDTSARVSSLEDEVKSLKGKKEVARQVAPLIGKLSEGQENLLAEVDLLRENEEKLQDQVHEEVGSLSEAMQGFIDASREYQEKMLKEAVTQDQMEEHSVSKDDFKTILERLTDVRDQFSEEVTHIFSAFRSSVIDLFNKMSEDRDRIFNRMFNLLHRNEGKHEKRINALLKVQEKQQDTIEQLITLEKNREKRRQREDEESEKEKSGNRVIRWFKRLVGGS